MEVAELEGQVDRALRQLPVPRAPRSLAPRVMKAIAAASRAAEAGWRHWSLGRQMLLFVGASWTAAALVLLLPLASSWIGRAAVARAAAIIWQAFIAPLAAPAIALVVIMCTACALLVAALKHVAWEGQRTFHS